MIGLLLVWAEAGISTPGRPLSSTSPQVPSFVHFTLSMPWSCMMVDDPESMAPRSKEGGGGLWTHYLFCFPLLELLLLPTKLSDDVTVRAAFVQIQFSSNIDVVCTWVISGRCLRR